MCSSDLFMLFAAMLDLLLEIKTDLDAAQTVQARKARHHPGTKGGRNLACAHPYQPDPLRRALHGCTEMELKAVLGLVQTQEELATRVKRRDSVKEAPGEGDEEDPKDKEKTKSKQEKEIYYHVKV